MGMTRYHKAIEILRKYMEYTGKKYIHTVKLQNLIKKEIAGTPAIMVSTLKMMRDQGIIKEVAIHKWEIQVTGQE